MFLVGHSIGGPLLVKLAAEDPSLFEMIVITAGSIDANQKKTETWRKLMLYSHYIGACREHLA